MSETAGDHWPARALVFARRQPLGTFGMVLVLIMAVAGLGADWIAPYIRPPTISRR